MLNRKILWHCLIISNIIIEWNIFKICQCFKSYSSNYKFCHDWASNPRFVPSCQMSLALHHVVVILDSILILIYIEYKSSLINVLMIKGINAHFLNKSILNEGKSNFIFLPLKYSSVNNEIIINKLNINTSYKF